MEIEGKRSKLLVSEEAMILAAGRGNRMRYFTKYIAKPLIKIENKSYLINKIVIIKNFKINLKNYNKVINKF